MSVRRANRDLLQTGIDKHATLCVGVLNIKQNSLCYSVAGHLPLPILVTNGHGEYLQGEGMPVGLFNAAEYTEKSLLLPDNFVLSLFTDGILEVLPADGILEKESYLLDKLQDGQQTIEAVVEVLGLEQLVDAPDDIAVLLITK